MRNIIDFNKKRETIELISKVSTVDPELKRKTLERMREIKKEQERKAAAKKKAAKIGLAAAAVIALVIAVTPLRGYVASAAESVYNAFHSWIEDVFNVGMARSDNGCSVEIIEARVANDFLYLTVDEDYSEFISQHPEYNSEPVSEFETTPNFKIVADLSGKIYDNKGNSVDFSSAEDLYAAEEIYSTVAVTMNTDSFLRENGENEFRQYKIYLPMLKNVINSYDKKYTCEVILSPTLIDEDSNRETLASFEYKFKIDNIDSVMASREYNVDYSYTLGNMEFKFEKLYIGQTETNMLVELIPKNELAEYDLLGENSYLYLNATAYKVTNDSGLLYSTDAQGNILMDDESESVILGDDYYIYRFDSRYFMFLTDSNSDNDGDTYHYENIINASGDTQFRVLNLGYSYWHYESNGDLSYNPICDYNESQEIRMGDSDERYGDTDVKFEELDACEIRVQSATENGTARTMELNETVSAGGLRLRLGNLYSLPYDTTDPEYCFGLEIKNANLKSDSKINSIELDEVVLVAEKDGEEICRFGKGGGDEYSEKSEITFTKSSSKWKNENNLYVTSSLPLTQNPTEIKVALIKYKTYFDGGYTEYTYVNPDYYDSNGLTKEENARIKLQKDFENQNIFTVATKN